MNYSTWQAKTLKLIAASLGVPYDAVKPIAHTGDPNLDVRLEDEFGRFMAARRSTLDLAGLAFDRSLAALAQYHRLGEWRQPSGKAG